MKEKIEDWLKKHQWKIVFSLLAFMFVVSLHNAASDSATFDEIAHIPAGYSYLTQHDMRLNPEHPPLIKDLAALPLLFLNLNFDTNLSFWQNELNDTGQWNAGKYLLWEAGNNPDAILFWSRLPIVLISLIAGLFIFKWVKELAGVLAGLLALFFYALDPNVLGHNHYVTTDIGVMAFLTFSFYYFLKFIKNPTWKNALVGGIFWGLLHVAKFSSITTLPIFGLILVGYPLIKKINANQKRIRVWFSYLGKGLVAFAVSMVLVWLVYLPNTYKTDPVVFEKTINFYFPANDSNPNSLRARDLMLAMNDHSSLRPMAEYVLGMGMVFKRVAGGNGAYFIGQVSDNAFPAYFPTVFILKETLPLLILIIAMTIFTLWQIFSKIHLKTQDFLHTNGKRVLSWLRSNVVEYTLFGFIVVYSYLSITGNLNIGLRHLFPIFPFIYILLAKKIHDFFTRFQPHQLFFFKYVLGFLLIWILSETLMAYPYYLSYFNELAGGPKNGYHYVTDSNADWGQDLERFVTFINQHPEIDQIRLNYFGGGNPRFYLGDRFIDWWDSKRPLENGWYAVSVNQLQGSIYDTRLNSDGTMKKPDEQSWRWITQYQPRYQIGTSILVYYVDDVE